MEHTLNRLIALLAGALGSIAALSGCSQPPSPPPRPICLGIVAGNRSNSAGVTGPMVAPLLPDPLPVGSVIVVTGVSGSANGDPLLTGVVEEIDNSYDQKDAQLNTRNSVIEAVSTAQATKPEADVLGAIESTAAKLRAAGLSCAIHVYDSGLQSIGLLEFQQNLLALDLRTVIDLIPTAQTLRNTKVVFETLGAVQDPQPALDATSLEKLSAIWQGVIAARGGVMGQPDSVTAHRPAEPIPGLPPVTVVPVPKRTIDFGDLKPSCTLTSTSWAMPANALFDGDEHVLKDDAKTLLDQAIQVLRQHPEAGVEIIGHTASVGTAPSGLELSQDRADAVADYLSGEGVDRSKITARGVGDTEPSCQDWDPTTSTQIEACAATERNVTLVATGVVLCDA